MAQILKGQPVAAAITQELIGKAQRLQEAGIIPTLAIVRVGENESDLSYERAAMKRCANIGIEIRHFVLDKSASTEELLSVIETINGDSSIHGCLMFRPLPKSIDEQKVCEALKPCKDADAMTGQSLLHVFTGRGEGFAPCTAQSCMEILDYYGIETAGRSAAVIGRSLVIGKPVSMMLQARNATVTMCHTKTKNIEEVCKNSEILVTAAGRAGIVTREYTNPGQTIIDVGINVGEDGSLCGDVCFDEVEAAVSAITPVPGGVGSVTTAVLCKHVIEAAQKAAESAR